MEVARKLSSCALGAGVRVVDFGIRSFDLTFALMDDHDAVILIDAAPRGGPPGTLYVIEPESGDAAEPESGEVLLDPHAMHPDKVIRLVNSLGGKPRRVVLVGCEPQRLAGPDDDIAPGLSPPVQTAVDEAVRVVESLVAEILTSLPTHRATLSQENAP